MTTILRDSDVCNNILEIDYSSARERAKICDLYEDGNLILLRGITARIDFQFINSLNFNLNAPEAILRKVKKYGAEKFLSIVETTEHPIDKAIFEQVFDRSIDKINYLKEQIINFNAQIDEIYNELFPKYKAYKKARTWRMTRTIFENLHWDNFHTQDEFHQVRIFCNLAETPRIWRTSHLIDEFCRRIYVDADLARLSNTKADSLATYVNTRVLGGTDRSCFDRMPKHHIAFEQGDIWLCETRLVSHQIYHGEQAFAAMYYSDIANMNTPGKAFDRRISALHAEKAQ